MKHLSLKHQLLQERVRNEELAAQAEKQKADLDYVAMMSGVDLDTNNEPTGGQENE